MKFHLPVADASLLQGHGLVVCQSTELRAADTTGYNLLLLQS